ncbi:hypothetical protein CR513_60135, partial [Mucuna pruriens]
MREPCKLNDLNFLHLELMDKLKDKKFLIVLDDIMLTGVSLKKPFQLPTVQAYHLNQLSNEDCWLVFANHACLSSKFEECY